jgi:acyl-coenzyme A thioesterase PaaI-like protein
VHSKGGVALCGACRRSAVCRLGLTSERLDLDEVARFAIVCPPDQEGGPGVAHGGWTAAVMDEVLGHVPILHGQMSVTGTLTIRYERPVPIGRPLTATAWVERKQARKWRIDGDLAMSSSGAVLAHASGIFVLRDFSAHFDKYEKWLAEQ